VDNGGVVGHPALEYNALAYRAMGHDFFEVVAGYGKRKPCGKIGEVGAAAACIHSSVSMNTVQRDPSSAGR
jgi:hypothetical protein